MTSIGNEPAGPAIHPRVQRLAAYSWRLLVIAAATIGVLWLARELAPVLIPATVALFLTRLLTPISDRLRGRLGPGFAAGVAMLVLLGAITGISIVVGRPIAQEAATLPETITEALDDIERWLVEDSPFDVSGEAIDRFRTRTADGFRELLLTSGGRVVDGATLAAEIVAGLFLSMLFTFFMLRDGPRFAGWLRSQLRPEQRDRAQRAAERGWSTLGGYLRGAALLGIIESIAIGLALLVSGASLVVPVMVLTFVAAFVPIIGAVFAGVMAVLVALVTGGVVSAAIVGVVAIVVQQLDNDILAPWVYALTGPPPRRDPRERRRRRGAVRHRWHAARRTGRGGSRQRRQGTRIEACRSSCSRRPIRMRGVPMRPDLLGRVRVLVRDLVRAALDLREDPARLALEARGDE